MIKKSEALSAELEVMRSTLTDLTENGDDAAAIDTAIEEFKSKEDELKRAEARESKLEEIKRTASKPSNRESAGVQVMSRVEPYEDGSQRMLARSLDNGDHTFDGADTISRAKKAIEVADVSDEGKEHAMRLLDKKGKQASLIARHVLLCGSDAYNLEFEDHYKSNGTYVGEAMRTAMSLSNGQGGFLLPTQLDPSIMLINSGAVSNLRKISRNETIAVNVWHGISSQGITAGWVGEAATWSDGSPSFTQPTVTCHKAAGWLVGSYEVLSDSGFASQVATLVADERANLEATALATGNTGATVPRGVRSGVLAVTASIVTSAATGTFSVGDLYNTQNALPARYQNNASFVASLAVENKVRTFETAGGGAALWSQLAGDIPATLLGRPIYQDSNMETNYTTGGKNVVLYGDFSRYLVVDRIGVTTSYVPVIFDQSTALPTGQAGWAIYWRTGADVLDSNAFRILQLNGTAAAVALA